MKRMEWAAFARCSVVLVLVACAGCRAIGNEASEPMVVVAAGARRAGSTELYNIARLIALYNDPNTVSGWWDDKFGNSRLEEQLSYWKGSASVVMKSHSVQERFMVHTDVVLLSHRNPVEQLCSFALMFPAQGLFAMNDSQSAIDAACPKWDNICKIMAINQRHNFIVAKSTNPNATILDVGFEHLTRPDLVAATIIEVAKAMRVELGDEGRAWVRKSLKNIRSLREPNDNLGPHHPITLMHENHVHTIGDRSRCNAYRRCLRLSDSCSEFVDREGRNVPEFDATPKWFDAQLANSLAA